MYLSLSVIKKSGMLADQNKTTSQNRLWLVKNCFLGVPQKKKKKKKHVKNLGPQMAGGFWPNNILLKTFF